MDTALSVAVDTLAVRLADEGVPLRAIARATHVSSSELRERLLDAQAEGRLQQLPPADWPPGYPKDQRSLQLSRMVRDSGDALELVVRQLFGLRSSQSRVLIKLAEHEHVSREALHLAMSRTSDPSTDVKIVDVRICQLRGQLQSFGIKIQTLWAFGYKLSPESRHKVMDLILQRVTTVPVL